MLDTVEKELVNRKTYLKNLFVMLQREIRRWKSLKDQKTWRRKRPISTIYITYIYFAVQRKIIERKVRKHMLNHIFKTYF